MWAQHLERNWHNAAAQPDVLRSSPCATRTRVVTCRDKHQPLGLGLVAQFNPLHHQKRPVDASLLQKRKVDGPQPMPSGGSFNFTKVRLAEYLGAAVSQVSEDGQVKLSLVEEITEQVVREAEKPMFHPILVNVSPLMPRHSLIVLQSLLLKPQRLERCHVALVFALLRSLVVQGQSCLAFNSAGAWASVNHLHVHLLFTSSFPCRVFPVMLQPCQSLLRIQPRDQRASASGFVHVETVPTWPMHCFSVRSNDGNPCLESLVEDTVASIVTCLGAKGIAHNVLFTRNHDGSARVLVFPRQDQQEHFLANDQDHAEPSTSGMPMRFAVAELCGLVIANDEATYEQLCEEQYARILRKEVSLTQEAFDAITEEIAAVLGAHSSRVQFTVEWANNKQRLEQT